MKCVKYINIYFVSSLNYCKYPNCIRLLRQTNSWKINKNGYKWIFVVFIRNKCSWIPDLWFPSYRFWVVAWQFDAISPPDRDYSRCPSVAMSYRWVAAMLGRLFRAEKLKEDTIEMSVWVLVAWQWQSVVRMTSVKPIIYLHKEFGIHGIIVAVSFVPFLDIGHRPQTHRLRTGIRFCLEKNWSVICDGWIHDFISNMAHWLIGSSYIRISLAVVVVASIRRCAFHLDSREKRQRSIRLSFQVHVINKSVHDFLRRRRAVNEHWYRRIVVPKSILNIFIDWQSIEKGCLATMAANKVRIKLIEIILRINCECL